MLSFYVNATTTHLQILYPMDRCRKNVDNVLSISNYTSPNVKRFLEAVRKVKPAPECKPKD